MRTGNLLFSAVQFIFVVALLLLGGLFLGLAHAPHLRIAIGQFITEHTGSLSIIGYAILGCSLLLLSGFYVMNRGVYYKVEMDKAGAEVDPQVISSYVQDYWNEIFPEQKCEANVIVHSNQKIEVLAEMPDLPLQEQKVLLSQIEEELGLLFAHSLGYRREFLVTILIKEN